MAKKDAEKPKHKTDITGAIKRQGLPIHGIFGLALLFVCVSIVFANYMVYFGTSDMISKLMLLPSTLFVVIFLTIKAVK